MPCTQHCLQTKDLRLRTNLRAQLCPGPDRAGPCAGQVLTARLSCLAERCSAAGPAALQAPGVRGGARRGPGRIRLAVRAARDQGERSYSPHQNCNASP